MTEVKIGLDTIAKTLVQRWTNDLNHMGHLAYVQARVDVIAEIQTWHDEVTDTPKFQKALARVVKKLEGPSASSADEDSAT